VTGADRRLAALAVALALVSGKLVVGYDRKAGQATYATNEK